MIQLEKEIVTWMVNYYEDGKLMQAFSLQSEDGTVRTIVLDTGIVQIVEEVPQEII